MPIPLSKIALLGDVHANLPALQAVLSHARNEGVADILNIGDFVGYGPFPNQVVKSIRKSRIISISGNYDLKVLNFPKKNDKWFENKHPLKWFAFKWAYEQLSKKSRRYLRSLPEERYVQVGGINLLMVHGSPASNEELLTDETSAQRLEELNQLVKDSYAHRAFSRLIEDTWFINTGSVGRPDDGDPRAAYAILEISPDRLKVVHYRLAYDVEKAVNAIRQKGLPEAFARMLIEGRDLETVLKGSQDSDG
jgi:predicted phosphodiesterase